MDLFLVCCSGLWGWCLYLLGGAQAGSAVSSTGCSIIVSVGSGENGVVLLEYPEVHFLVEEGGLEEGGWWVVLWVSPLREPEGGVVGGPVGGSWGGITGGGGDLGGRGMVGGALAEVWFGICVRGGAGANREEFVLWEAGIVYS